LFVCSAQLITDDERALVRQTDQDISEARMNDPVFLFCFFFSITDNLSTFLHPETDTYSIFVLKNHNYTTDTRHL
jgi:hypothetical protein